MSSISFRSVYDNPALFGECLVIPLKNYRIFFLTKNSALWKLAHCISGLIAYPVLGAFALIGMGFKWHSSRDIEKNQRNTQAVLDKYYPGLKAKLVPGSGSYFSVSEEAESN